MKKIFVAMMLAVAMIFVVGQSNYVEARDVYIGNYSDGTAVYLLTQTVYRSNSGRYTCTVRAGGDYLNYTFLLTATRGWMYTNSEGYSGQVYNGSSPIAPKLCDYLRRNF